MDTNPLSQHNRRSEEKETPEQNSPRRVSLVVIVVTALILDKWTQQFIPILERDLVLKTSGIPPCDSSLKIERAGASPGNASLPAAKPYGSKRGPRGETCGDREHARDLNQRYG